ncbi:lysophospholipase [Kitasatospora purpeofusca]|uniref:alpha/beta hydrolase n=1 Tax=Kitasatospora purpeofusca TaxID=67352 RepID=UPI0022567D55|nr:alpha/beta fold hydrolase [Kitasatospora purpeofusca]MCX4690448.1 lysophospholipase [Kitasatospora purpeofusca]
MTTTTASPVPLTGPPSGVWEPAADVTVRGTVLLLPGRGEHPGVYARFGRRLAFDGYRVVVPAVPAAGSVPLDRADLAGPVAEARRSAPPGTPVVLAGSDTGALLALAAARQAAPDGLLLVGLPTTVAAPGTPDTADDWTDELGARTSCPAHRGLLAADPDFRPGALAEDVPADLVRAAEDAAADDVPVSGVPVLVVHGSADPVSPPATARRFAERLAADLVLVADGRHDALNDAAHRSVAAAVVQWLERLRGGPHLPAQIVTTDAGGRTPDPRALEGNPA